MIKLLKYDLNSEFESNKDSLKQLDNYVAFTEDNQMVHLKPLPLPNILVITTNNTGTTINKRTDNQDGKEKITLENGENTFTDWNYGFYFFYSMKQNQITSFDLSKYDTSNVTNMSYMFQKCSGLTSLDVSSFDTSKVTNMGYMFQTCSGLTSLDLSSFDTYMVKNMTYMFIDCSGLTSLNVSNFNTSKVTDMGGMFSGCTNLTALDLSSFTTSNVIYTPQMFDGCTSLTSLDLSNFDAPHAYNVRNMFQSCSALSHIKCKQAFKDWCWTNQDTIKLPTAMRNGGEGQWDIVDA